MSDVDPRFDARFQRGYGDAPGASPDASRPGASPSGGPQDASPTEPLAPEPAAEPPVAQAPAPEPPMAPPVAEPSAAPRAARVQAPRAVRIEYLDAPSPRQRNPYRVALLVLAIVFAAAGVASLWGAVSANAGWSYGSSTPEWQTVFALEILPTLSGSLVLAAVLALLGWLVSGAIAPEPTPGEDAADA